MAVEIYICCVICDLSSFEMDVPIGTLSIGTVCTVGRQVVRVRYAKVEKKIGIPEEYLQYIE